MRLDCERHDLARPLCRPRIRRAGGFPAARRHGGEQLGEVLLRMGATGGLHRANDGRAVPIKLHFGTGGTAGGGATRKIRLPPIVIAEVSPIPNVGGVPPMFGSTLVWHVLSKYFAPTCSA